MRRIVAFESITLDGVMQAPGRPDEDRRGGFEHGGWAAPYADDVSGRIAGEGMAATGGMVFGRRTYEDLLGFWSTQPDSPFAGPLLQAPKYVASRSLDEPLPYPNSTLLSGDAVDGVRDLRAGEGKDLVILGSGDLVRQLAGKGLIDEYTLLIHPLVLGTGRRLFAEDGGLDKLRLVDTTTTTTGVIVARYQPEDAGA